MSPRVLAGSARSGTTWVADAIAEANGAGTLFEPLNPEGVPAAREVESRRLAADAADPPAERFFDALFAGSHRNVWTLGRVYRRELVPVRGQPLRAALAKIRAGIRNYRRYGRTRSDEWVYKMIRANLMLGWLERRYRARIALVVRHPGAVVASRVRRRWPWRPALERHLVDCPQPPSGGRWPAGLLNTSDEVIGHTALWCVQHTVALADQRDHRYTVHFYEDLRRGEATEWRRLATQLAFSQIPDDALLQRPSQQADQRLPGRPGSSASWRAALGDTGLERLDHTLARFDNRLYVAERDEPTELAAPYRDHT